MFLFRDATVKCMCGVYNYMCSADLRTDVECSTAIRPVAGLSDLMCLLVSFRKSTPTQDRQLYVLISNSKQLVDGLVGVLTFQN